MNFSVLTDFLRKDTGNKNTHVKNEKSAETGNFFLLFSLEKRFKKWGSIDETFIPSDHLVKGQKCNAVFAARFLFCIFVYFTLT